jgi:hypothetical protein
MYKGKTNIEIVKSYLVGERLFPTFGYVPKEIRRNPGDIWQDSRGVTWRQEVGYRTRVNPQADMIRKAREEQCKQCHGDVRWGTRLDRLFFSKTGLCENCLIDYETKLRIVGVYPEYERFKVVSNEIGHLKEAKAKLEEIVEYFSHNDGDVTMICNEEGFTERWKNTNKDQILKDSKNDLKLCKKTITALTKIKNEAKKKYYEGAKKYKLEVYGR